MRTIMSIIILFCLTSPSFADDNIVVVFDTSGSMAENMRTVKQSRMKTAQDALVSVLTQVPPTTKVGIITFNGWIYDLQPVDRAKLEEAIRGTSPSGGTPLYGFIKKGADRLLEERAKQNNIGYYKLVVVTDGEAQDDSLNQDGKFKNGELRLGYLRDTISRGINVDAMGLDMKGDHALATQINGSYMRGDDPAAVQNSLKKSVAEVGFDGKDGVSQEAFNTINEMPENFARASLSGLTEFLNQPIGELPMVKVINADGTVSFVPNPDNPAQEGAGGMRWYWILLIFVGFVFALVILNIIMRK